MKLVENFVKIKGSNIAYNDEGEGQVFLFIHGNPTSKFIWRNILPRISKIGRAIAFDSIGMGNSDKLSNSFTFETQYEYLEAFIKELNLKNVILVLHDWGGALGLHYAKKHPEVVSGVVAMEILYNPVVSIKESGLLPWLLFKFLKLPWLGKKLVVDKNIFIEKLLQLGTIKRLPKEVMESYRKPFKTLDDRKSIKTWVEEIPYKNHNEHNLIRLQENAESFKKLERPKLLFHAWPGFAIPPHLVKKMKKEVSELQTVNLGIGLHFVQEDHSEKIAEGICNWYEQNKLNFCGVKL